MSVMYCALRWCRCAGVRVGVVPPVDPSPGHRLVLANAINYADSEDSGLAPRKRRSGPKLSHAHEPAPGPQPYRANVPRRRAHLTSPFTHHSSSAARSSGGRALLELRDALRARHGNGCPVAAGSPPPAHELVLGDVMNERGEVSAAVPVRIFDLLAQLGGGEVDEHHLLIGCRQAPTVRSGPRVRSEASRRANRAIVNRRGGVPEAATARTPGHTP